MSGKPTLYYREEEIFEEWDGRRVFVNRELVGTKRGLMEFSELAALSLAAQEAGHSVLACSDGTLIQWSLEGKPHDFKDYVLGETMRDFDALEEGGSARVWLHQSSGQSGCDQRAEAGSLSAGYG